MAIREADPWRLQYFAADACPEGVEIPTEDADAWAWNPRHRWVYDKLQVALSQGLAAAPMGVPPQHFPVFAKPVVNLRGMGVDSRAIADAQACDAAWVAGHFWMELLEGEHVSSDAAVVDGRVVWWRHATGVPAGAGTFDRWVVHAARRPALEAACAAWVARHLKGYTGMLNLETIGGGRAPEGAAGDARGAAGDARGAAGDARGVAGDARGVAGIIEVHLRFADQWPDLYGAGWVAALIRLYAERRWAFDDAARQDGHSVVLFGPHGRTYRHPPSALVAEIAASPGVSSVQITFHQDRPPERHAMPPGGFRLAIVNGRDLEAGRAARRRLADWFGVASG